jgi:hypothetical protein
MASITGRARRAETGSAVNRTPAARAAAMRCTITLIAGAVASGATVA